MKTGRAIAVALVAASTALAAPVAAAEPQPSASGLTSPISLVHESDAKHQLGLLRPAGWSAVDDDLGRVYQATSVAASHRLSIEAVNFAVAARQFAQENILSINFELFRHHPDLAQWSSGIEQMWLRLGVPFQSGPTLAGATSYVLHPATGETQLVAYLVRDNQPIALVLDGRGSYADLSLLASGGILDAFRAIIASVSVTAKTTVPAVQKPDGAASSPVSPSGSVSPMSGPYHRDSGHQTYGAWTYRMETDYYQAPPRDYWMYEYLFYDNPYSGDWLFRADITDNPVNDCTYGNTYLITRYINKSSPIGGPPITDSYYPNLIVAHLNPSTAHMIVFGVGWGNECQWYFPFTT